VVVAGLVLAGVDVCLFPWLPRLPRPGFLGDVVVGVLTGVELGDADGPVVEGLSDGQPVPPPGALVSRMRSVRLSGLSKLYVSA